jgi:hypothetical protein
MLTALAERPTLPTFPAWLDALLEVPPDVTTDWPLLATPVPTGFPAPVDDQVERHLSLDEHLIHNPGSTFLMRVQGDDWWEQGIHHGDLLVVDRAIPPQHGQLGSSGARRRVRAPARGPQCPRAARLAIRVSRGSRSAFEWSAGLPNLGRGALGYTPTVAGAAFILIRDWCSLSLSSLYSNSMRR